MREFMSIEREREKGGGGKAPSELIKLHIESVIPVGVPATL